MLAKQRVVKSIPDRQGRVYTKTNSGGKLRMQNAARYMDERENTQLYVVDRDRLREIDRHEVEARIEDTETRYQQHLVFTTQLDSGQNYVNERELAESVARSIQDRRPDADVYAVAVHSDGKGEEKLIHVHAIVGTETTLRREDLRHFREAAYQLELEIELHNGRSEITRESIWGQENERENESRHTDWQQRSR
ncbi:hypothetical protein [Deinococcus sp. UR1]|uniref:hypothetical protein n=1 Tax=Deinococcus sp. UR1 TaxID=1704277 RepID=UPI0011AF6FB2|nr:hypothetical protein [Deinococcus sp. UR1]